MAAPLSHTVRAANVVSSCPTPKALRRFCKHSFSGRTATEPVVLVDASLELFTSH